MNDIEKRSLKIIEEALDRQVSDIHFQPKENFIQLQFRIAGELHPYIQIKDQLYTKILSHFKFQANMDIGEKRRPQNGALTLSFHGKKVSIRLSTMPTPFNESLVLRLLPQENNFSFKDLFLFPNPANRMPTLIQEQAGFMILTGPTGSGKTTTIYALLHEAVSKYNRRVITIEDPVEKINDSFTQLEVNERAGITFSEGFKASLRHDPDVIMIGEIRDAETAKIAIKAALSGHLIITTMHAKNTIGALYRLLEFGISFSDIQQTVTAVATQNLINTICPNCKGNCGPQCISQTKRRLAIFELLSDQNLIETLAHIYNQKNPLPTYPKLRDEINKAIQLGYLPKDYNERWNDAS